jgi:hypothetical protein
MSNFLQPDDLSRGRQVISAQPAKGSPPPHYWIFVIVSVGFREVWVKNQPSTNRPLPVEIFREIFGPRLSGPRAGCKLSATNWSARLTASSAALRRGREAGDSLRREARLLSRTIPFALGRDGRAPCGILLQTAMMAGWS